MFFLFDLFVKYYRYFPDICLEFPVHVLVKGRDRKYSRLMRVSVTVVSDVELVVHTYPTFF